MTKEKVLSVSEYLDKISFAIKGEKAKLIGEVTGVKVHQNGHYYFSLLDKTDQSKMECVVWSRTYTMFGVEIKEGLEVVVSVVPNLYKPHGKLSFIVNSLELAGEGALKIAYEKLKKKLETEGLLAESRKRPLPDYPHRIGVITSKTGAVINDFSTNIGRFGYKVFFADSRVEGAEAVKDLLDAMENLKKYDLDVLVIMRGGGGIEAFQAFNNETLVRAVARYPVPTLTGIGHDKDVSLVSLVSDKNVSTPTAVANFLNSTWVDADSRVSLYQERILSNFQSKIIDVFRGAEQTVLLSMSRIESGIARAKDRLKQEGKDLIKASADSLKRLGDILVSSGKSIELFNPERQLKRGYSIVKSGGKVVKKKGDVKKGEELDIHVSDGIITSQII